MKFPGRLSLDSGRDARGGAWGGRKAKGGRGCGLDHEAPATFWQALGRSQERVTRAGMGFFWGCLAAGQRLLPAEYMTMHFSAYYRFVYCKLQLVSRWFISSASLVI